MNYSIFVKEQEEYCLKNGFPVFITRTGECPRCHMNIFEDKVVARTAGEKLITGCPHCMRSYCD